MSNDIQSQDFYRLTDSRGGDTEGILHIPTAIRTCSTRTATTMAVGSTPTMTGLTTSGTTMTASRSSSRRSLHFFSGLATREVLFCCNCLKICPFQPPSILPISSKGKDSAAYFLLSSDLASHSTISKILRVSVFLIANLTHGCFSSLLKKLAIEMASMISIHKLSTF